MRIGSEFVGGSSVENWARSRLGASDIRPDLKSTLENLVSLLEAERHSDVGVFLSVVIRTQAKRWEQIKDSLLCLAAQTDRDFEVLMMLHNVTPDRAQELQCLVDSYPDEFAARVRLIPVNGGGRVRPLSESINLTRGSYLAFYDDDDLLMANWVEAFHRCAESASGQVIRANVATQLNHMEQWSNGAPGQRTIGIAKAEYADWFDLLEHLQVNHSPFMGIAIPRSFFSLWGERFDEELPVCEDWDIVLRAVTLLGVHSSDELTAIYRQWQGTATSYTQHEVREWRAAEDRVRAKIDAAPFFMPSRSVDGVLEILNREHRVGRELGDRLRDIETSTSWRMTGPFRRLVERARRLRSRR